ncbi:MAG: type II toxin-antitoxin system VapC family toxin [Burkholderiaceae bacterium]|nr:type II toxin-antitoxin system VapC family toxin [Burkholderiaceae bacterium]
MIAFLDASALIYLIEGAAPLAAKARQCLRCLQARHGDLRLAVSRLTWLECRVGPLKTNDAATLAVYDAFFARPDLLTVEIGARAVELAAVIRAHRGLKTPDALQAACCLQLGAAHVFVTGDAVFDRVPGLQVTRIG